MNIKIKKENPNAKIPYRATNGSAGADLHACIENSITIQPRERILISTGISMDIGNENYGGFVFPRSGTASKFGITLSNCVGVIDSDYRGEIKVPIINLSEEPYTIHNGDRIAQLVIIPVAMASFNQVDNLDETKRNSGGFGSTGK